jgi:hypothetical protein
LLTLVKGYLCRAMKQLLLLFITLASCTLSAQSHRKDYFPIWSFDRDSIRIHGVSFGFLTDNVSAGNTLTNGVRVELLGLGFLLPIIPSSPIAQSDGAFAEVMSRPVQQKVNGLNLCVTGTVGQCCVNGLSAGGIGQSLLKSNGVTVCSMINLVQQQNGLMLSMFNDAFIMRGAQLGLSNKSFHGVGLQLGALNNYAEDMSGVQIGLFNKSKNLLGLQFGLWNVNQKRKMPLVNWCFRRSS